jgi:hypothetical protein
MNAKTLRSLFVIPLDVKPEGSWAVVPVISEGPSLIQSLDAVRAGAEFEIVNRADPDALPETVLMNSTMLQGYHATPLIAKKVFRWTTGTSFRIRVKDSRTPFWKSPINRWMMSASLKGLALDVLFAGKLQRVGTSLYRARLESLSLDDPFDVLERGISLDIAMQKARDYEQLHGGNLSLLLSRAKDLNPLFRERLVTGDPPNFALVVRQENGKKKVYVVALDLSHQWPDSTEDYRRRIQLATLEAINAGFPLALDYDSVASIIPDIRQLGNYKESPMSLIARITPKLFEVWMSKESGPVLQILARSS